MMSIHQDKPSHAPITHKIRDATGKHIADHVRVDKADGDKDCFWRLPDGTRGLNGKPLSEMPLYGSEKVADWHKDDDDLIILVEGEKAADALDATNYFCAVGTACGAGATPGPKALEVLRDRRVCLWPDNDDRGRDHMKRIGEALQGVATQVLMYTWDEAPDKGDAADHPATINKNRKAYDWLLNDLESAPRFVPERIVNRLLSTRVDMGKAISEGIDPPAELEPDILLEGKIHHLFGPSEHGKTIIALWLVKRRVEARQHVVVFDAENGPRTIAERLKQMGADPALVSEYLIYLPFPDLTLGLDRLQDFYNLLDEVKPTLIIFDSWASFLSAAGLAENENSEIEHWDNALTKQAKARGIASAILDHVPHDADRSRGGARKKEVADVQWRIKKTQDFDRDSVGEVLLIKAKDREGWLPPTVKFSVGGRHSTLTCNPSAGTIEEVSEGLSAKERIVLETLIEEFPRGAKQGEWEKATESRGVSRPTHHRARRKLVSKEVSSAHRVSRVNDTYFPPNDTPPPEDDDTSEKPIDTPDSQRYHEVSSGYHDTDDTPTEPEVSSGSPPLKGGPVIPDRDTDPDGAPSVAALFANPPEWVTRQLGVYQQNPQRHLNPLCVAVAAVVLEDGMRAIEVRKDVEAALSERGYVVPSTCA
jgi:hypothetical protein